ncbi:DUF7010 family protein [Pararhodonellum marinum]|uniref:DUF7010 family protein n=1 Tax=Pararhodonellum marinum TaxID=2755358 RepID=UPI0018900865|nr:hypothetical protein [Pararhodonellum marinum]
MIPKKTFDKLRIELSVKLKNGLDFTLAASIIWLAIGFVWTLNSKPYDKSVLTFIVGSVMLPLALLISKIIKTTWTIKENPLQPLGLWLNFAQLFYFPFLVFTLIKLPDYFVMVYAIITGAHFFPYSWFYKTSLFAIFAGLISLGSLAIGLTVSTEKMYFIPFLMSIALFVLTILLHFDSKKKQRLWTSEIN